MYMLLVRYMTGTGPDARGRYVPFYYGQSSAGSGPSSSYTSYKLGIGYRIRTHITGDDGQPVGALCMALHALGPGVLAGGVYVMYRLCPGSATTDEDRMLAAVDFAANVIKNGALRPSLEELLVWLHAAKQVVGKDKTVRAKVKALSDGAETIAAEFEKICQTAKVGVGVPWGWNPKGRTGWHDGELEGKTERRGKDATSSQSLRCGLLLTPPAMFLPAG